MNSKIIEQLRRDEGEVLHAYDDHLGFATIGVGRLIDKRRGGGISAQESAYLLNNDIARVDAALRSRLSWYGQLDEVRQGALINMGFQLGIDGLLGFTRSLACIRDGRFAEAETHLLASKWAEQTPARARRIARQVVTGEWQ
jgi:lysozyme